jgi:Radical SAM superfamily/B12 binding domain
MGNAVAKDPRIAFVAVDLRWEDQTGGFTPFSYAAYKLDASLRGDPELAGVQSAVFDLPSADPERFLEELEAFRPTLVAASTYVWSTSTFMTLARRLKERDPSIRFVMGGPSARRSVLELPPYRDGLPFLDAVVTGEGEEVMRLLAREHLRDDWKSTVPGLSFPGPLSWRTSAPIERPVLDDYPTPYQVGTAPSGKMGFMETFRGCPIHCAFCQWGEERSDRVHGSEYLAENLRALDRSDVNDVLFLDAAFNLSSRAFRHLLEAERQVGALAHRSTSGHIYPIELKDQHFELMARVGHFRGCIGIQSFDEQVLKRLGRPSETRRLETAIESLRGRITIEAEFIMGLPGDTPASFRRTFHRAVELCDSIRVFWCLALPDALLERAAEFDISFDPRTFKVESCAGWSAEDLKREWDYMLEFGAGRTNLYYGDNWLGFATVPAGQPVEDAVIRPRELAGRPALGILQQRVAREIAGWRLERVRKDRESWLFDLGSPGGEVVVSVEPARPELRSFLQLDGLSYSHRGKLGPGCDVGLRRVIQLLHRDAPDFLGKGSNGW